MSGAGVVVRTPVRVADVGGWTDTWFGAPGRVCSVAVGPAVEVRATFGAADDRWPDRPVHLVAPDIGVDEWIGPSPDDAVGWRQPQPGAHPLLEHAVAAVLEPLGPEALVPGMGLELVVSSSVPPGASLGTSASVVVAVLGALDVLVAGGLRPAHVLAALAHEVEVGRARREAGVQDQWAAAVGGVGLLAISPYPEVRHRPVLVPADALGELERRLVTVVFGPHDSSALHAEVIDAIVGCGGAAHDHARRTLARLAALADDAAAALTAGDLDRWGAVLVESASAQGALHAGLVGAAHQEAIEIARSAGAVGWKVNGAGGEGGSLTVLAGPADGAAEALAGALARGSWRVLALAPSAGLLVER